MAVEIREKNPDTGHWDQVTNLFQTAFWDGLLPAKFTW